jgi:hypothetical protein
VHPTPEESLVAKNPLSAGHEKILEVISNLLTHAADLYSALATIHLLLGQRAAQFPLDERLGALAKLPVDVRADMRRAMQAEQLAYELQAAAQRRIEQMQESAKASARQTFFDVIHSLTGASLPGKLALPLRGTTKNESHEVFGLDYVHGFRDNFWRVSVLTRTPMGKVSVKYLMFENERLQWERRSNRAAPHSASDLTHEKVVSPRVQA